MAAAVALLGLIATPVAAQVCVGTTVLEGPSFEIGAELGRGYAASDGFTADITLMPERWIAVEGGYRLLVSDTLFNAGNEAYGRIAIERSYRGASVCPVLGLGRAVYSEPTRIMNEQGHVLALEERHTTVVQIPVGVGFGRAVRVSGPLTVIPHAYFGRRWQNMVATELDRREVPTRLWVRTAGLTATLRHLYVRASATSLTRRDHKPEYSLHIGVATR